MIIHSTFTDGYFNYAILFLESFKYLHKENRKIVFTTTDLQDDQIQFLHSIYSNLVIHNQPFDYGPICRQLDITIEEAKELKWQVEHNEARIEHKDRTMWKLHVAAEKRVVYDIPFILKNYSNENVICHFDIDMYFRKPIYPIFKAIRKYSFSTIYRPKDHREWRRTWICIMGIRPGPQADRFFKAWRNTMIKVPLKERPFAWGQASCFRVYKRLIKKINLGRLPESFVSDGVQRDEDALIWSGNNPRGGNKDETLEVFRSNLEWITRKQESGD